MSVIYTRILTKAARLQYRKLGIVFIFSLSLSRIVPKRYYYYYYKPLTIEYYLNDSVYTIHTYNIACILFLLLCKTYLFKKLYKKKNEIYLKRN